jgi:hypothetical protein
MLLYSCWIVLLGDKERTRGITELVVCVYCDLAKKKWKLLRGEERFGPISSVKNLCA